MASKGMQINIRIAGSTGTLAAFKELPKDASDELRDAALKISDEIADKIRAAGAREGRQARKLATTVKSKRDRFPRIDIGGSKRLFKGLKDGSRRQAFETLAGSEFGASSGHGFRPFAGQQGHWVYPTIRANQADINEAWHKAADAVIEKFTAAPDGPDEVFD